LFEDHVYAQLGGVIQSPKLGAGRIELAAPDQHWASLLSSKGRLISRMAGRPDPVDQPVRSHWCTTE